MKEFLKAISALNDETRVVILKFLTIHKEACVCDIENSLNLLQSRLSRHLKILKDAGFLDSRREGVWIYYYVHPLTKMHELFLKEVENLAIEIPEKKSACGTKARSC